MTTKPIHQTPTPESSGTGNPSVPNGYRQIARNWLLRHVACYTGWVIMRAKSTPFVLMCAIALIPLQAAGYLASTDVALSSLFDSVLTTEDAHAAGPLPREVALRRLVDRTTFLLEAEGRDIDRDEVMEIARIADRAGLRFKLPPSLILSVIHSESHFREDAVSVAGAIGLMQVQAETARHFAVAIGVTPPTTHRLFDPEVNILLGTGYLRHLIDRFGNLRTALAAYHVGPTEIGRRLTVREPFSDRYGKKIRQRETYFLTAGPSVLVASNSVRG